MAVSWRRDYEIIISTSNEIMIDINTIGFCFKDKTDNAVTKIQ